MIKVNNSQQNNILNKLILVLVCCSATLTASGVRHGDLLVLTRPQDAGLDRSDNPMAVMQDGTPGNPAVSLNIDL